MTAVPLASHDRHYQDVVIGSSPLMLLQAHSLAKKGRFVGVLERSEKPGGAWRTLDVGRAINVEIACHVIEPFPNVYEYLEEVSAAPFVILNEQPIRIYRNGIRVRYFSRLLLLASGMRLLLGYLSSGAKILLGTSRDKNRFINFKTKLSSFLKYQTICLVTGPVMKGPKYGFADFLDRLVEQCRCAGVVFRTYDVAAMTHGADGWVLENTAGDWLQSTRVHCTTSTNLRKVKDGIYESTAVEFARRVAVVVDVPRAELGVNHTYVAFWKDPHISRISRIDSPGDPRDQVRFLVEFRKHDLVAHDNLESIIREKLLTARIVRATSEITLVGHVDCTATKNVDQLPKGQIDTDFFGYFSSGNLAAGIASWLKLLPPEEGGS